MVKVKICGITNLDDALLACELGADALGFVFYKPSPRYLEPQRAGEIMKKLPPFVAKVGVFVNLPLGDLNRLCQRLPLDLIQLHGDETADYCHHISRPVLKAFRVKSNFDLQRLRDYQIAGFVLDAYVNDYIYGGSGATFDWRVARDASRFGKIVLAGGLHADNVIAALRTAQPYAVDVSSGVEAYPGKKDPQKLKSFFGEIQNHHVQSTLPFPG
jgi:phosphoribosylanthranilate isomerase